MPYAKGVERPAPIEKALVEELRTLFCESEERPTFAELSEKTGVALRTIHHRASVDGWLEQRATFQDQKRLSLRVKDVLADAESRVNQPLIDQFSNAALALLQRTTTEVLRLTDDNKPSGNIQVLSSASFVLMNTANACKAIGIVGLPKALADAAKEGGKGVSPALIAQLNVTIGEMQAKALSVQTAKPTPPTMDVDETPAG